MQTPAPGPTRPAARQLGDLVSPTPQSPARPAQPALPAQRVQSAHLAQPADPWPSQNPPLSVQPPAAGGPSLPLPHERDQGAVPATGVSGPGPVDPVIRQAHDDIRRGLVDTDMRATPGLDAGQRERMVPGAGGAVPEPLPAVGAAKAVKGSRHARR